MLRGETAAAVEHANSFLSFSASGDLAEYTRWFMERLHGRPLPTVLPAGNQPFGLMSLFPALMAAQLGVGLGVADEAVEWGARHASEAH